MNCLAQRGLPALGVSRGRFSDTLQVERYEDTPGGDVLVHLAEASNRGYANTHAPSYEHQRLAILKSLQTKGFSRVIYASSAVLYGDQGQSPRKVGDPVFETDAYSRLKLASERVVLERNGVVARLANLYGPGMAEGNVISTIFRQLQNAGPVRVFDFTPVRDFLWVGDAARGLADMVSGEACGIFNVGSGEGVSIHELAAEVLSVAGQAGRQLESTHPENRFSRLVVDIAQTEAAFGWRPAVTLAEGIATLVKMNIEKE